MSPRTLAAAAALALATFASGAEVSSSLTSSPESYSPSWSRKATAASSAATPAKCGLVLPGGDAMTTKDCVACHAGGSAEAQIHSTHPVGVDQASARPRGRRRPMQLRSVDEVVKLGLLLPDGKVECVTCHDGRSQWKYRLALPTGAVARVRIDPKRYASQGASTGTPDMGAEVDSTSLCRACHVIDD